MNFMKTGDSIRSALWRWGELSSNVESLGINAKTVAIIAAITLAFPTTCTAETPINRHEEFSVQRNDIRCIHSYNYGSSYYRSFWSGQYIPFYSAEVSCMRVIGSAATTLGKTSSAPYTWFQFVDDNHILGLNYFKEGTSKQFSIFSSSGKILAEGHVSADELCFRPEEWSQVRKNDSFFYSLSDVHVTEHNSRVFVDFWGYYWDEIPDLKSFSDQHRCPNHISSAIAQTELNYTIWYDIKNPNPKIIFRNNKPIGIEIHDPKGENLFFPAQYLWE